LRKQVQNNDSGDSTHFGGNDLDYINQYLTGTDQSGSDPVVIATTTQFKNQKLQFINPSSTFNYVLNAGAIAATRNISLPVLTADDTFVFANAGQNIYGSDSFPAIARDGQVNVLGNNTAELDGVLTGGSMVGAGSLTSVYDTTEGMTLACATTATGGLNAGYVASATGIGVGRTLTNMRFTVRAKASATTTIRQYVGFTSLATLPITDTPLGTGDSGIIVGYTSADSTWQIFNNDGSGTAVKTAVTGPISTDTNFHYIDITIPAGGSTATITIDNTVVVVGSRLPATTTNLFFNAVAQTTTTVARTYTIRYIQASVDR
jgi:hypothetical protein